MGRGLAKIKNRITRNLKNTYCRLQPSKIEGVGVFAIRDIPKNTNPFKMIKGHKWYKFKVSELKDLDKGVLKMIDDLFVVEKDSTVFVPEFGLNEVDISFFLNHSNRPNMKTTDGGSKFTTLRKIKKGEELTVSYKTYC